MNIFDLDKNSLPEQVQKNKENIATLMTDPTTKQYVDDQDAATLQSAKDYTDDHVVPYTKISSGYAYGGQVLTADGSGAATFETLPDVKAANVDSETATAGQVLTADGNGDAAWQNIPETTAGTIDSETATAGQVLTADGNGDAAWQTPSTPIITASDVDSETATSGQVLQADGNGGAAWGSAGGSSLNLIWSGSVTVDTNVSIPATIDLNKKYILGFEYSVYGIHEIEIERDGNYNDICVVTTLNTNQVTIFSCLLNYTSGVFGQISTLLIQTSGNSLTTDRMKLKEIYEVL